MYDLYRHSNKFGREANPYSYITWNDNVVSRRCYTATAVRFANLHAQNEASTGYVYVHLYIGIRQGEKYFGYYEDVNFDKEKLLSSIEKLLQSEVLDHSSTQVEYPVGFGVSPLNSRGEDELVILLTLKGNRSFMSAIEELMGA